jgi:hypothetical protein
MNAEEHFRPWPLMQVRGGSVVSTTRRGGGIRTHDLFVPNDTTSGPGDDDGAGKV